MQETTVGEELAFSTENFDARHIFVGRPETGFLSIHPGNWRYFASASLSPATRPVTTPVIFLGPVVS